MTPAQEYEPRIRSRIMSPCSGVCEMDAATGRCSGCARTLDEIANWVEYSDEKRSAIMDRLHRNRI